MAYPTGGDKLDEYLQTLSAARSRMPASGQSTAARAPASPMGSGPGQPTEGPMTSLMKQGGNQLMGMGRDYFQRYLDNYFRQQQMGPYAPPTAAGGGNMAGGTAGGWGGGGMSDSAGAFGGWSGGGMDMVSGLGGGGADFSMLAY